ncbi:hypothetical protein ANANG_G00192320 [Anguilla anguilla]|uniref:UDENN domain-containing protein n=1 Tax=Anguilla anguilla TaxID=7936 RepID=A0A9D3M4X1_ANGAN|nr:hypothetical protein ANANG_G00192320 [Anguilla anguilla]
MGSRIKESPESTFEVYVEVTHPGTSGSDPEVRRLFPEDYIDQETLQTLTKFCFPFNADSLTLSQVGQNFTFVLTDIESKQRFGFCRLSSGARSCFCILSYLPWFEVFYKLLNVLADYTTKGQDSQWKELLERLHTLPVPEPGVPVHLSVHSYFTVPDIRELPSIPENRNLTEYFVAVDVNNMLHLYASMLYERRIIICCSKLSTLTACVHGSAAMLYPMYWQHVYIPVLPQHLVDYCCAPMPYLIGVHSSLMEKVKGMVLEDVVMLNVDTNTLETPFDDLQSLPNDVVSALKNRLKKVSTTTGDGVARAFLKAQAALFGSYRNALKIEPEEPITFSEETFVTHRSSGMRQFLQSAIQLQLFKQFIDGRLELLNSGEGFSDVFEEEINMGEYAGSDKTYHQWLSTVKKGSGAIFNTVKTKANPAMKTVYKFAKDHARMGIKEVKNRLKQKDMTENGYAVAGEDVQQHAAGSPSAERKEVRPREERRPITVHFGQARPPRPLVVKRPRSNVALDARRTSASSPEHFVRPTRHYTVFLSEDSSGDEFQHEEDSVSGFSENFLFSAPFEWPQPYRTLKECDFAVFAEISLLDDIFGLEGELESQTLTLAKSLEDLRTPKDPADLREQVKFSYQRMDLIGAERTRTLPTLKHSNPYNKLWSLGLDDMALPCTSAQTWDRPLSVPPPEPRSWPRPARRAWRPARTAWTPRESARAASPSPGPRDARPRAGQALQPGDPEAHPRQQRQHGPPQPAGPLSSAEGPRSPTASRHRGASPGPALLAAIREDSGAPSPVPPAAGLPAGPAPFPHISLNPFTQSLRYPPAAPHRHYPAPVGTPSAPLHGPRLLSDVPVRPRRTARGLPAALPGAPGFAAEPRPGPPRLPPQRHPAGRAGPPAPPAPVPAPAPPPARETPPALPKPPTAGRTPATGPRRSPPRTPSATSCL